MTSEVDDVPTELEDVDVTLEDHGDRRVSVTLQDGEEYEPLPMPSPEALSDNEGGKETTTMAPIDFRLDRIPYSSAYRCSEKGISAITGANSVFIPKASLIVQITDAIRQTTARGGLNPYLYTVEVRHGKFTWTIRRRYKHFNDLHDRLQAYRVTAKIPIPTKKHRQRRKTMKGGKSEVKIPHFPKRPEATIKIEGLQKRRVQLENYINAVVQNKVYREHNATKKFFGISKISFIEDLGVKAMEGVIKKQTGSHKVALNFLGRCCPCCDCTHSNIGLRWADRWFVVKDTFIAYLDSKKLDTITGVFLFDGATTVEYDGNSFSQLLLTNQSRKMKLNCWTERKAREWKQAIEDNVAKYSEDLTNANIRLQSFAPPRPDTYCHWFVDGRNYMNAVADAMEAACEEIFITDWFFSPQLYLKRPIDPTDRWRLDKILQRKANQGVKVYVLLWKEIKGTVTTFSCYAKSHLSGLNSNISVLRHPDFAPDQTLWAHHEKIVVIDQSIAFIGGIDLCYGRWDDHLHRLVDQDPNAPSDTTVTIGNTTQQENGSEAEPATAKKMPAAMPLTMMGMMAVGLVDQAGQTQQKPPIKTEDEEVKESKTMRFTRRLRSFDPRRKKSSVLSQAFSNGVTDANYGSVSDTKPLMVEKKKGWKYWRKGVEDDSSDEEENHQQQQEKGDGDGNYFLQKYQQMADHVNNGKLVLWPGKDYYNMMIRDFAELDNPFADVLNRNKEVRVPWHDIASVSYGKAARDAARHFIQRWNFTKLQKKREKETVHFLMPKTYSTNSFQYLDSNPHLRVPQAVKANVQVLRSSSVWSAGIFEVDCSIQNAYQHAIGEAQHFIYIENQFFITMMGSQRVFNKISLSLFNKIVECHEKKKTFRVYVVMPLIPGFEGDIANAAESRSIRVMLYYQFKSICRGPSSLLQRLDDKIGKDEWRKYISFCGLRQHSELNDRPVTEIIYVHSKMLIVDDRITIIGSANINDRSMDGSRDSEVAIIVEDNQFVDSTMDEKPYKAGVFSSALRRRVFSEHLGLLPCDDDGRLDDYDPLTYVTTKPIDDVTCDYFFNQVWMKTCLTNTATFEKVFRCIPSDSIKVSTEIATFYEKRLLDDDVELSRKELAKISGTLVQLPLMFLSQEDLLPNALSAEGVLRLADTFL